ncbi:MAG: hypothetical protein JWR16_2102 [Nevskia sp.]|nr:hypothetical protein [Nevskia sp.]
MQNRTLMLGILAAFALLIGVLVGAILLKPGAVEISSGTLLPQPRPIADFSLSGSDGQPYTKASLAGHWSLIFAGYTFCPDVCPTTLAELKGVLNKLGADAGKLQVVFISVDPERDTPQRLAQYVHYFSPDFRAATGEVAALEKLGQSLGFVFVKVPGATPESYLMDHSAALMLVNPQAELVGYLTPPFKADAIAADLKPLLQRNR